MRYAIDAPTLLHLVRDGLSVDPAHRLVAPNAVRSAALQLLLAEVRAGELTERDVLELHERITEVKIRLLGDRVSRRTAWRLARELDLETIAEAEYLAVATLQADALVTVDPRTAAIAARVVAVVPPTALASP
ncbi:hypothetical protein OEB99_01110 [Actinotalea sp. M2MS4P-6]|uniref:hypothetical protein n=1 Tax=Actinotalea sp. M2MS4P-6 TaxID=2983762 RepID=UPI0021E3D17D|nr:hypothetical protein [Actinotalea sp. M2MS4P-6]MCV2392896.1 hypothetical protein [Actinotalea sp. M2MS4P-6]